MAFGHDFEDEQELSEINMTPLVDVMLVLLIIFMLTVPVMTDSIPIELPQANARPSAPPPTPINLSLAADGQLFYQQQPISLTELRHTLQAQTGVTPQPSVQLQADKAVAYDHVAQVMAAVQQAGISQFGFVLANAEETQQP